MTPLPRREAFEGDRFMTLPSVEELSREAGP